MRAELIRHFCGRCGNECRGFEAIDYRLEPPRRCARCAIDKRFFARTACRLLVMVVGLLFVGSAMAAIFSPAEAPFVAVAALSGWLAVLLRRRLVAEDALVESIRERDEKLWLMRIRLEKDREEADRAAAAPLPSIRIPAEGLWG